MDNIGLLKQQLEYSPDTGNFTWRIRKRRRSGFTKIGQSAGHFKEGYLRIIVDAKSYRAHRLAWVFMTGSLPPLKYEIDHINGVRADNRWCNLRMVTRTQGNMNRKKFKNNTSGFKGVSFNRVLNKWRAGINKDKKFIFLGNYKKIEDAINARLKAEEQYFGEYARKNEG